ncbi:MAG: mechanosensitive ion channel [Verrucomicrobiota bacterium]|nr:mechanosensitive ion channel [Verrucomicrobiota bacterium]
MKELPRRPRRALVSLLVGWLALINAGAQTTSPSPSAATSPKPTPAPTAVPLADVVAASDAASERLDQMQSEVSAHGTSTTISQELPATTREIDARLDETKRMLAPGVPLETLRDLETRWQRMADQLAAWSRDLTERATFLDRQLSQLPDLRTTWRSTLELARTSDAPPELTERVDRVLKGIDASEAALQKGRATVLTLQTRVAEQTQRVQGAMRSLKAAQSAAVNRLWVQDSPPMWSPEVRNAATAALVRESQVSLGVQATQLRDYAAREWTKFVYLALLLLGFAFVLVKIKRQTARWTDHDPSLERANRVLQSPLATSSILAFIFSRAILNDAPRLVWIILATLALIPIVALLRRLIDRHLFPIVNALVVFYVVAQLRALAAALPVLSRFILLLEMIGGAVFLAWFVRSTRTGPRTTSRRATRAAARVGVVLFVAVFITNLLGYVALANYLGLGALATAYLAVLLYAAAGIVEGLILFALQIRPLSSLAIVQHHRPLLRRRIGRGIRLIAFIIWLLLSLGAFSIREAALARISAFIEAEITVRSLHLSLGAVLAFALTIWITLLLSRFVRFLLEEELYDRLRLARGSAYAVSTLAHYVILLVGFYAAIAAVGADMTKFAILAGAFGVGIGFGLQNIFNNFFSGLILLFERPVQVGDVVEVSGITGVVRRIGIRASIIMLGDNSQLIIPNGQLISEKVTNRTISSRQKRMNLSIRLAYGSDPPRVLDLLAKTAAAHPKVLKEPAPEALLKEFGADALIFEIGFSTDDVVHFAAVQSDVAVALNLALRDAGIEIPLPQRAVHLENGPSARQLETPREFTGDGANKPA